MKPATPVTRTRTRISFWSVPGPSGLGGTGVEDALPGLGAGPLEVHQHVPQRVLQVAAAVQVLLPGRADDRGVEVALVGERPGAEQVLGPRAQGSAQPRADRDAEPHLGAVHDA